MKNKYISISILKFLLFLGVQDVYAQNTIGQPAKVSITSPSNASLSSYSDVPVNESTGIPNIDIPLLSVPMSDHTINLPIGLSYNLKNFDNPDRISDVGFGWSFLGTSAIYKKIVSVLDECYDSQSQSPNPYVASDDIYYYNLPGLSGRFMFKREPNTNTVNLVNLSPNNVKIEYVRESNTGLIFRADQFTITTDDGYKYYFLQEDLNQYFECSSVTIPVFKSAYYLTKIVNPLGAEIATLDYSKRTKNSSNGTLIYQNSKIKSIKTPKGEVTFDFAYDENLEKTVNDPYTLNKVTLKNPAGEVLYSYSINSGITSRPYDPVLKRKRILNSVIKNDKNNNKIEQTSFTYKNTIGELDHELDGPLENVNIPTGGKIQYNYEGNEKFFDYNDPGYLNYQDIYGFDPVIQVKETIYTSPMNTQTTTVYNFTIPGDVSVAKNHEIRIDIDDYDFPIPEPLNPDDPFFPNNPNPKNPSLKFVLKKGTQQVLNKSFTNIAHDTFQFFNSPGNYTLEVTSIDQAKGIGSFSIIGRKFLPGPFRNSRPAEGRRISNIKYYKNTTAASPERTINYAYDSFTQNNSSSGYEFNNEKDGADDRTQSYVLYKNVKVWESGKGFTKKTFKNPDDYPKFQNGGTQLEPTYFWPYYNVTKTGLPFKEEIYNEQNNLIVSREMAYDFGYYSDTEYDLGIDVSRHTGKPSYITTTRQKEKLLYSGGKVLENESETRINALNFKPAYTKSVIDGDLKEKWITYPINLSGYSHLENAYMTGMPVITEEKANGKLLAKSLTLFNNGSLLPTSVLGTNIATGGTKESLKMDVYDNKGNLLQISNSVGTATAMIYGYNQTLLIAKVEGATYNQVVSQATDIINASNNDNLNSASEPALITALDNFRKNPALANYQITTYTYDPLVGVTSTTQPSGLREVYEYDNAGRLKTVKRMEKDTNGAAVLKTVQQYQYNYKQ
ncbi:hypothetical protein [Chryseobacterium sp.]|uniref:hypothetical protein n=1 Tax=Chryseobacterium sp. TaxID=1871047 RepID=UPI0025BBEF09|nr:hypothetical protein [Chryseobacterium sp.]MBV8326507.1 hypothetical protein [Chryseobacterium sp.]